MLNQFLINVGNCKEYDLELSHMLLLIAAYFNKPVNQEVLKKLTLDGYLYPDSNLSGNLRITQKGVDTFEDFISKAESRNRGFPDTRVNDLSIKMKEIYPKGKKPGSNYYWADGTALIARRLRLFFKKYGTDYEEEDILDATRRYVKDFENNMKYMKLLKYFIFKEATGVGGDIEPSSDLLNYIEHKEEENSVEEENWTDELR